MYTHVAWSAISDFTNCLRAISTTANMIYAENVNSADSNMLTYENIN